MTPVIHTERLTKAYGAHRGISELDLDVEQGEIFGFLGPNGAGKTTTMRVLLDLIRPTSGRAEVFGMTLILGLAAAGFAGVGLAVGGLFRASLAAPVTPMGGVYDPVGIVIASVLVVGGLATGAWGLRRRDVDR